MKHSTASDTADHALGAGTGAFKLPPNAIVVAATNGTSTAIRYHMSILSDKPFACSSSEAPTGRSIRSFTGFRTPRILRHPADNHAIPTVVPSKPKKMIKRSKPRGMAPRRVAGHVPVAIALGPASHSLTRANHNAKFGNP
jgi:hypothetical protein